MCVVGAESSALSRSINTTILSAPMPAANVARWRALQLVFNSELKERLPRMSDAPGGSRLDVFVAAANAVAAGEDINQKVAAAVAVFPSPIPAAQSSIMRRAATGTARCCTVIARCTWC